MELQTCPLCHGALVRLELYHPECPSVTFTVRSCVECAKAVVSGAGLLAFTRKVKARITA